MQPDVAVVIMTAYATVETAVEAMKHGAYDYLVKPFDPEELSLMMVKIVAQQAAGPRERPAAQGAQARLPLPRHGQQEPGDAPGVRSGQERGPQPVHDPDPRRERHRQGTARPRHPRREPAAGSAASSRCRAPRSPRRCSSRSCSATRKASFTGAVARRKGKFETAHGGTLFLDEIGDISRQAAARPAPRPRRAPGSSASAASEPVEVDVRIIAATNRDLQQGRRGRRVPRGPLLPAERHSHHAAAAARPARGHPAAGRALPRPPEHRDQPADRGRQRRGAGRADAPRLAGQRARAAQRPGARPGRGEGLAGASRTTSA